MSSNENTKQDRKVDASLMSRAIDFLRFPLIVGVIFIHNYRMGDNMDGIDSFTAENLPVYYYVSNLFSNTLASIAVPLFFFISGYLFFFKVQSFTKSLYLDKLRKRFKTLLIPYIFWNLLLYGAVALAGMHPMTKTLVSDYDYSLFEAFIGKPNAAETATYPLVYQLWFIRDLIVCVIISPLIYLIVTRMRYFGILLLGVGWFLGCSIPFIGVWGLSMVALFYFSIGAWFSCRRIDVIELVKDLKWVGILFPVVVVLDLLTKTEAYNSYIHRLEIVMGIIACFLLVTYLIEHYDLKAVPFLSSASFFIFAVHDPWILWMLRKSMFVVFQPTSDIAVTLLYFAVIFVVVMVAIGIYWILKRVMPGFTSLITGSR